MWQIPALNSTAGFVYCEAKWGDGCGPFLSLFLKVFSKTIFCVYFFFFFIIIIIIFCTSRPCPHLIWNDRHIILTTQSLAAPHLTNRGPQPKTERLQGTNGRATCHEQFQILYNQSKASTPSGLCSLLDVGGWSGRIRPIVACVTVVIYFQLFL